MSATERKQCTKRILALLHTLEQTQNPAFRLFQLKALRSFFKTKLTKKLCQFYNDKLFEKLFSSLWNASRHAAIQFSMPIFWDHE